MCALRAPEVPALRRGFRAICCTSRILSFAMGCRSGSNSTYRGLFALPAFDFARGSISGVRVWGFGLFPASAEFFPVLAPGRFVALGHRILFPCKPVGCRCGGMGFPRVHNNPEQGLGVIFCVCSVCCICPPRCCPFPSSVGNGTPALFRICVLLNFGISAVFVARRPLARPFAGIHALMTAD